MAELLIAVLELLEAEGRTLRRALGRLAAGVGLLVFGCALGAVGAGFLLVSLYRRLAQVWNPNTASLVTGLAALVVAGGLLWTARRLIR